MSAEAMKLELLRLMEVRSDSDWGPDPYVCRWCGCWLRYSDRSEGKPEEEHAAGCFAVKYLGRPTRVRNLRATADHLQAVLDRIRTIVSDTPTKYGEHALDLATEIRSIIR